MAGESEELKLRRIVVVLEPQARALGALDAAARLAARMQAELDGLFIEDEGLLRLAALPFAREIGFSSASARTLDVPGVERWLRALADEMRRGLAAAADRSTVARWSFRVARGAPLTELRAAALAADLLLTAHGNALNVIWRVSDATLALRWEGELRAALGNERGYRFVAARDDAELARRLGEIRGLGFRHTG